MKLELVNINKYYGKKKALQNFNLSLSEGIYGILGPNGAGKSSMMNLITDNVKRDDGKILFDDIEILKLSGDFRKVLGYMPQQQGFYEEFSARAYMLYMARLKGLNRKQAKLETEQLLSKVNLSEVADKKVSEFSGGMRQRVLLAQALLGNPKVLILDEPTAGLDPKERIRIRNLISELSADKIILLATHVVSDVECLADKIILIKNGKLIRIDTPRKLISSIKGKVFEKKCEKRMSEKDMLKYPNGNVVQREDGLYLRVVGEREHYDSGFVNQDDNISLEDVYLYYIG